MYCGIIYRCHITRYIRNHGQYRKLHRSRFLDLNGGCRQTWKRIDCPPSSILYALEGMSLLWWYNTNPPTCLAETINGTSSPDMKCVLCVDNGKKSSSSTTNYVYDLSGDVSTDLPGRWGISRPTLKGSLTLPPTATTNAQTVTIKGAAPTGEGGGNVAEWLALFVIFFFFSLQLHFQDKRLGRLLPP